MSLVAALRGIDLEAEAAAFKSADPPAGQYWLNDLLLDVRAWRKLAANEIVVRIEADPLALLPVWELGIAAPALQGTAESDPAFVSHFADPAILLRLAYIDTPCPEDPPHLPRCHAYWGGSDWSGLRYLQDLLRWAQRFGGWAGRDRRALRRLLLCSALPRAILQPQGQGRKALLHAALEDLGVECASLDPAVAAHHFPAWILAQLGLPAPSSQPAQRRLEFREAGGTPNSLFAVRAVGGVDGYDVRGQIGPDMGLIIDLGDRDVSIASTAYLEESVVQLLSQTTELGAELAAGSLRLRWYDNRLDARAIGRIIYETVKARYILSTVSVSLIFDPLRISSLRPAILSYREEREQQLRRRTEENSPFVACTACKAYAPHAFCLATPERPPCCGRSYDELASLAQLTRSTEQFVVDRGICIDRAKSAYISADKAAEKLSDGEVRALSLHCLRDRPHPTTAIPQCIVWEIEGLDVLAALSRNYGGRSPDGRTYQTLLSRCACRQTPGMLGVSEAYFHSPRFLAPDGGLARLAWMDSGLKKRLGFSGGHIATELECTNMAALKEHLQAWRR